MLEKIDLERVFKAARQAGFSDTEVYAETRAQTNLTVHGRIEEVRLSTQRGLALRCHDGRRARHFFTHRVDTAGLLEVLAGGKNSQGGPPSPSSPFDVATEGESTLTRALQPPALPERVSQLTQWYRATLLGSGEAVLFPALQYEESIKYFEVAHAADTVRGGVEETAELGYAWSVDRGEAQPRRFRVERCRSSIETLFRELKERNPLPDAVKRSLCFVPPWPAPRGELPVLWSARALSKLHLQFLRAFEGDLVLGNLSFLTELALPVALPFAVEDRPDVERLSCDNEGSPRRPVTIFHQGRPKALACNNWIAEQLAVPSTGHCRRQSFTAAPTVGFWNPRVVAHQTETALAARLDRGLSVHDIEILQFDLSTGEITIRLRECYLVHQGAEGEPVESVVIRAHLLELLRALECFDAESETIGLPIAKNSQRFITEVSTPRAISRPLPIPGSVPPSHYW